MGKIFSFKIRSGENGGYGFKRKAWIYRYRNETIITVWKKNPDVVDFLNKNMMIAEDEESGFRVVLKFKKDER